MTLLMYAWMLGGCSEGKEGKEGSKGLASDTKGVQLPAFHSKPNIFPNSPPHGLHFNHEAWWLPGQRLELREPLNLPCAKIYSRENIINCDEMQTKTVWAKLGQKKVRQPAHLRFVRI